MHDKKNFLIDGAVLLALLAIGAAGYWFSPLLLPKSDVIAQPEAGCDLNRQACAAALPDGGRIELSLSPRPIPTVKPLAVEVRVSGLDVGKAEIDFAGIGMNMGYNRTTLAPADAGRFTATASLPVCITGSMPWQVTVLLDAGRHRISIPFRFDSATHPL